MIEENPTNLSAQATTGTHSSVDDAREQLVDEWTSAADPVTRCLLAHQIADLCADPADELAWDERALADADAAPRADAAMFYPSLHLNLAASHLRLGDDRAARGQLDLAQASQSALGEDPYSDMIRGGIARMRTRIDALQATSPQAGQRI